MQGTTLQTRGSTLQTRGSTLQTHGPQISSIVSRDNVEVEVEPRVCKVEVENLPKSAS